MLNDGRRSPTKKIMYSYMYRTPGSLTDSFNRTWWDFINNSFFNVIDNVDVIRYLIQFLKYLRFSDKKFELNRKQNSKFPCLHLKLFGTKRFTMCIYRITGIYYVLLNFPNIDEFFLIRKIKTRKISQMYI